MKTLGNSSIVLTALLAIGLGANAQANTITFTAALSGANQSPPIASPATGFAEVIYNDVTHMLEVIVSFSGLTSPDTASHIHAATAAPLTGTAGVATTVPTFPGFPSGVTSGSYDQTMDLTLASSFNPSFVTANGGTVAGAETALVNALMSGEAYLNIHTVNNPGGEIRGFLLAPDEAETILLLTLGLMATLGFVRRQRRAQSV